MAQTFDDILTRLQGLDLIPSFMYGETRYWSEANREVLAVAERYAKLSGLEVRDAYAAVVSAILSLKPHIPADPTLERKTFQRKFHTDQPAPNPSKKSRRKKKGR